MVKVTMGEILSLNGFIGKIQAIPMPMSGAYKLSKIRKDLTEELGFYREKFNEILEKYGAKNPDGSLQMTLQKDANGNEIPGTESIKIIDGMEEECNRVLDELQHVEVEFNNRELSLDDLGQIEMTIEDMGVVAPFIKE